MSALRELLDLHQYGQALNAPPLWLIMFGAYAVLLVGFVIAWGRKPKPSAEERAADDQAEAAWLAARMDLKRRQARKDKRGQGEALDRLQVALHAKMRAEMGQ